MISFNCSQCGEKLKVKDELAGKKGKCPRCQHSVTVPAPPRVAVSAGNANEDAPTVPPGPSLARSLGVAMETATQGSGIPQFGTLASGDAPAGASRELYDFLAPPQQAD